MTYPVDAATCYRLLLHEAAVHAVPDRRLTDFGDSILLLDPVDPEPFWNRLAGVRWPADPDGFDRRLTETSLAFAAAARQPHVWLTPPHDGPPDLLARLLANGFEDTGSGLLLATADAAPSRAVVAEAVAPGITLERYRDIRGEAAQEVAADIVDVLLEAFGVVGDRRDGVRAETVASLADPRFTHYLVRLDGTPAAAARRATFDGISYLSSIGTTTWARGRGLGRLVTATATADAFDAGSEWAHLGAYVDNVPARTLYERLGYRMTGEPGPDLLLVG